MTEFETILRYHEDGFHGGPVSICTICFPQLRPTRPPSENQRELARKALEALKARVGEDVAVWAWNLVEDVVRADD